MTDDPTIYGLRAARQPALVPDFVQSIGACRDGALAVFDADGTMWVNDVADDFTLCGGDVYARGHVRTIAKVVGADPDALVAKISK